MRRILLLLTDGSLRLGKLAPKSNPLVEGRKNPFLPYWSSIHGVGPHVLQSPNNLRSAIGVLKSLPTTDSIRLPLSNMVRRCSKCHRYTQGAPVPELDHHGSNPGNFCSLAHHPSPCDWANKDSIGCTIYSVESVQVDQLLGEPIDTRPIGAGVNGDLLIDGPTVADLQRQLEMMVQEKESEARKTAIMEAANQRLRDTQNQLMSLYQSSTASTTTSTTMTTTSLSTSVAMSSMYGTGYSVAGPRVNPGSCPLPFGLSTAISSHARVNATTNAVPQHSISGYSGNGIPGLRSDPSVNPIAQQVMAEVMRLIPALAPLPSANAPVPPFSAPASSSLFGVSSGVPVQQPTPSPSLSPAEQQLRVLEQQLDQLKAQLAQPGQVLPQPGLVLPDPPRQQVHQDPMNQLHYSSYLPGVQQQQQQQQQQQVVNECVSLESLYNATIKYKQYRALDFCKLGCFNYSSQIKANNMNLALFSYGSIKHLLALMDGTLQQVSNSEFVNRLQHILNVLEISCLGSSMSDFDTHAWKVGREYDSKIVRDIETGHKSWETLGSSIDPTAWAFAKELVPPKTKPNNDRNTKSQKICTTWNTFKDSGCHYEHNNAGETCVYQHICSKCKKKHKAWQCDEQDVGKQKPPARSTAVTTTTVTPVVTSG